MLRLLVIDVKVGSAAAHRLVSQLTLAPAGIARNALGAVVIGIVAPRSLATPITLAFLVFVATMDPRQATKVVMRPHQFDGGACPTVISWALLRLRGVCALSGYASTRIGEPAVWPLRQVSGCNPQCRVKYCSLALRI